MRVSEYISQKLSDDFGCHWIDKSRDLCYVHRKEILEKNGHPNLRIKSFSSGFWRLQAAAYFHSIILIYQHARKKPTRLAMHPFIWYPSNSH